jgi:hypothetical protein
MGAFIFPLILVITFAPAPQPSESTLADFSRFSKTIATRISLVERDGTVREGTVSAISADAVTLMFGIGERTFQKTEIFSAERLRDSSKDGALRGVLFGAFMGLVLGQGYDLSAGDWLGWVSAYAGIGWAIDAAQTHRQPIYRVPGSSAAAKPTVKMSLRF